MIKTRFQIFKILFDHEIKLIRIDYLLSDNNLFHDYNNDEIRFIHKITFGVLRHKSKIDYYISKYYKGNFKKLLIKHKIILRIGVYQLFYMDSTPNYAAVNTTVDLCKKIDKNKVNLVNAIMRKISQNSDKKDVFSVLSIEYCHPKWLIDKWSKQWSDKKLIEFLKWNNKEPQIWFRINTLKTSKNEIHNFLKMKNIDFIQNDILKEYFTVGSTQKIIKSELMKNGLISVQNPASGLVVKLLNPKKNEIIFDGCAAPGGKSTYISELTAQNTQIHSYDNDENRIKVIESNLERLNINNIKCYKADLTTDSIPKYKLGLIDVPCSGTGVISKRIDIKWRRSMENIYEMINIQSKIIKNVSKYLDNEGILVYSTCSVEEEENWAIIDNFLNCNKNFRLDKADKFIPKEYVDNNGCLSIFPPIHNLDGIFAARLIKK